MKKLNGLNILKSSTLIGSVTNDFIKNIFSNREMQISFTKVKTTYIFKKESEFRLNRCRARDQSLEIGRWTEQFRRAVGR